MKDKPRFTAQHIKSLRTPAKGRDEYFDGSGNPPGFGFRISSKGTRTWIVKYRPHGLKRVVTKTLGRYPKINLQQARQLAKQADVERENPEEKKKHDLIFSDLADLWYQDGESKWKDGTKTNYTRRLTSRLKPQFGDRLATEISRKEVDKYICKIKAEGKLYIANECLFIIKAVYKFGMQKELVDLNPCYLIERAKVKPRQRVFTNDEIRKLFEACPPEPRIYQLFIRFLFLTLGRCGEIEGARWIDWQKDREILTLRDTKKGADFDLPLASQATEVLRELEPFTRLAGDGRIFPKEFGGRTFSRYPLERRLRKRMGVDDWRFHDIRRTGRTRFTTDLDIRWEIAEHCLDHDVGTQVSRIYDQARPIRQMKEAFEQWARDLDYIIEGKAEEHIV